MHRALFVFLLLLCCASELQAQVQVHLRISRRLYVAYEPIVATIQITNLAGRDITLHDADGQNWLGFQIRTDDERLIPPRDVNYQVAPITIASGETLKRSVNIVSLYPVTDFGLYRVRANVYFADMRRYFSSTLVSFEISDGKLMWQQKVGVPEGQEGSGEYRLISLMTFRQPKDNVLYVRIEDEEQGIVFCTYPVGRVLANSAPQWMLDAGNNLHLLQLVGPKSYAYTRVGIDGELQAQRSYSELKTRPRLKKDATGHVGIAGGQQDVAIPQTGGDAPPVPKISDRPPGMPQ